MKPQLRLLPGNRTVQRATGHTFPETNDERRHGDENPVR